MNMMIKNNVTVGIEVASPCVKLCKIDAENSLCIGCYRTLDEISVWSRASAPQKLQILQVLELRRDERDRQLFED